MRTIGWLCIALGACDFILFNFLEYDIYKEIFGIIVPESLNKYTAIIAIAIGGVILNIKDEKDAK